MENAIYHATAEFQVNHFLINNSCFGFFWVKTLDRSPHRDVAIVADELQLLHHVFPWINMGFKPTFLHQAALLCCEGSQAQTE